MGGVLRLVRTLPAHGRGLCALRLPGRAEDDLVRRGLLELRQRAVAEVDHHRAVVSDLQVLLREQLRAGVVAHLPAPLDLLHPGVHSVAEQLLRDAREGDVALAGGAAEEQPGLLPLLVEGGDALHGVVLARERRGHLHRVPAHRGVRVEQPPLAVAAVRLHRGVGEVAVDVPVRDVGVDLGLLDRGHPLDHLAGHRGVVVEGVLVDVDGQFGARLVGALEQLLLPRPVLGDAVAHRLRVAQLVPGDDVREGAGRQGVGEEALHLVVQDAGVGAGDTGLGHLALDEPVEVVPGGEEVVGIVEPADLVVAPLAGAEHVALGLVERHEDDVVLVLLRQLQDLVDLVRDLLPVELELLLGRVARPLVREAAVDVGHVDVHIAVGGVGQRLDHLQRVGTGVLRAVLRLGGDRAQAHALHEVVGGHVRSVHAVEGAGGAAVERAGVRAEVDGELSLADHGDGGPHRASGRGPGDGERPGLRVLLGRYGVPGDRYVAVVAVGEGGAGGGREGRGGPGGGTDLEGRLRELLDGRHGTDRTGHLLGAQRRVPHGEVVDRALEQRVRVEGLADVAGGGGRTLQQVLGLDAGLGGGDRHAVEVGGEPARGGVEGDGHRPPLVRRERRVTADLRLRAPSAGGHRGLEQTAAVVRGAEEVPRGVGAQVEDPLPGRLAAAPLHARGDRQVGRVADHAARQADVRAAGVGRTAGQSEGLPPGRALDGPGAGGVHQVCRQAVAGTVGDLSGGHVVLVEGVTGGGPGRLRRVRGGDRCGQQARTEGQRHGGRGPAPRESVSGWHGWRPQSSGIVEPVRLGLHAETRCG